MNRLLEELVLAFDAHLQDPKNSQLWDAFRDRIKEASDRTGVSQHSLIEAVRTQHRGWWKAQKKHSTLPPQA